MRVWIAGGLGAAVLAAAFVVHPVAAQTATPGAAATPGATAQARTQARQARVGAFLDNVAKRLNTTPDNLRAAFKGAAKDAVQARLTAGKITQDQANKLNQRIDQGGPFVGRLGRGRR